MDAEREKYALITGATSGFGYEFARLFAKDRYNLVLVARSEERLQKVAEELYRDFKVAVIPMAFDLFRPDAYEQIYVAIRERRITIDVLVNDAGQGQYGKFVDYELARDFDLIQLNITSLLALTKLFLKDMLARNDGKILQVSSLLSKYPTPLMTVYAATKAFVSSFTEGLINEVKGTNVTVTALLPGAADTDFFLKAEAEDSRVYREENLDDPAKVAKDGYDALMNGESRVISGFKNKVQAALSSVMPDSRLASSMRKQMSPSSEEGGRDKITHGPSVAERSHIKEETGEKTGDVDEHQGHVHDS
jgi:uncharacterized protein